jgi:hypothetical protein
MLAASIAAPEEAGRLAPPPLDPLAAALLALEPTGAELGSARGATWSPRRKRTYAAVPPPIRRMATRRAPRTIERVCIVGWFPEAVRRF